MKAKDKSRKWMWMFLAALVSRQVDFVWELLASRLWQEPCTCCIGVGHWLLTGWPTVGIRSWWPRGRVSTRSKMRHGGHFGVRVPRQRADDLTNFWPQPEHTQGPLS